MFVIVDWNDGCRSEMAFRLNFNILKAGKSDWLMILLEKKEPVPINHLIDSDMYDKNKY